MEKGIDAMENREPGIGANAPMETSMDANACMEPGLDANGNGKPGIDAYIRGQFAIAPPDLRTYSPLTLAFIGDGVYDLVIRSMVVGQGNTNVSALHHKTSHFVKANAQANMIEKLLPALTPEEADIYRRGKNAKSSTMAKNATIADYHKATGFEALMGFLYLNNDFRRIVELVKLGLETNAKKKEG